MSVETSLTIISIAMLLLLCLTVCVLVQIFRVLKAFSDTVSIINSHLPNILSNIQGITATVGDVASSAKDKLKIFSVATIAFSSALAIVRSKGNGKWWRSLIATVGSLTILLERMLS